MAADHQSVTSVVCSRFGFTFQVTHRGPRQLALYEVIHPEGKRVFTRKPTRHPFERALSFFIDLVVRQAAWPGRPQ